MARIGNVAHKERMRVSPWRGRSDHHLGVTVSAVRFRLTTLACQTSLLS